MKSIGNLELEEMPEDTQKAWSEVNVWDIGLRNIVPFLRQKREGKKAPLCLCSPVDTQMPSRRETG